VKALVFRGPGSMPMEDRPDPRPAAGEIGVAIRASGICGSDVHGFSGATGRRRIGVVMGHEAAGVVDEVGAGVTSVSVADGKQLWEDNWSSNFMVQPAMTAEGDIVVTSQENGARRIGVSHNASGWNVTERWTSNGLKPYFNDFVIHKGYAFGFDGRILACIDLKNGERKWKGGRYGNGQLVLLPDQDLLLVVSEEGELALVKATPDQFTELARFKAIEGKTWNHPVLVGDVLLVRNGEEMAAFRVLLAKS